MSHLLLFFAVLLGSLSSQASTLLVTGATRGLGYEFIKQHASAGWTVYGTYRNLRTAGDLEALAKSHAIHWVQLDVGNPESIRALADKMKDIPLDLLINNAGIKGDSATQEFGNISSQNLLDVFSTNVIGPLLVSQALITPLQKGTLKCIVTLGSNRGSIANTTRGSSYAYGVSKAAVHRAMRGMAVDLKPKGIHVLLIHPGWVKTTIGGEAAEWEVEPSVTKIRPVIAEKCRTTTGEFFDLNGLTVPW